MNRIEAEVAADDLVVVFRMRAMPAQKADLVGKGTILRDDRAAVAEAAEVLRRENRITADRAHRPGAAALVFRADRLGGVFDDGQLMLVSNIKNRVHLGTLPKQMHRHDRL